MTTSTCRSFWDGLFLTQKATKSTTMAMPRRLVPSFQEQMKLCILSALLFQASAFQTSNSSFGRPSNHQGLVRHQSTTTIKHFFIQSKEPPTLGSSSSLNLTPLQGDIIRTACGAAVAAKVSISGLKTKKSLRQSGAIAAFAVASLSLACSFRSGATLLGFYATSSKMTRLGSKKKKTIQEDYEEGGRRGAQQVLSCSLIGVVCAIARRLLVGADSPLDFTILTSLGNRFTLAYVLFFACCAGDTWASELGVLSKSDPRLITKPWKKVAPGTNGGISKIGLAASAAGGLVTGIIHGLCLAPLQYINVQDRVREIWALSIVGLIGGLGGSLIDSLLGATIQITHYDPAEKIILKKPKEGSTRVGLSILSNEMVNVVSTAATALLGFIFTGPLLSMLGI